ncbi:Tetratricopeptide repeat protein [Marinomonas aquimarina]|uniref:Tetratricopeptide repeat protein n=1 Tax=Marinomonas aquimarina TaxID=295068 RepID=A0A1A8SYZ4_9GAMM|nr:tetratricopeptide repeat protein [Marinomonas aquimarina]SBS24648.1 Tetratricopeptide repeat protein [Marinomonas aquimarina]
MQRLQFPFSLKRVFLPMTLGLSLCACSSVSNHVAPLQPDPQWAPVAQSQQARQLEQLLAAEFALQRQGSQQASAMYLEVAKQSNDAEIAKRATSTAVMSDDTQAILDASERWLALSPDATEIYPVRLQALLTDEQTEQAAQLLKQAAQQQLALDFLPNFIDQNVRNEGITSQLEAILTSPELAQDVFVEIARYHLLFINGGYPYIVENIDQLMARSPKSELEGLFIIKAFSEEQLGFKNKAERTLQQGLRRHPNSQRIQANLLEVLIKNNKSQQALEAFYNADFPPYLAQQIGLAMGQLLIQQGHLEQSIALLSELPRHGVLRDQLLFMLATAQQEAGEYNAALANLASVFGQFSWTASELIVKWLYDAHQAELINSIILKRAALDAEPGHVTGVADLHLRQQNPALAIDLLTRSLAVFPEADGLRYKRAITYDTLEQWPSALADLKLLLEKHPNDPAYLNALGYTMMVRSPEDFEQAFALIQRAYALDDEDPAILDSMGWGYYLNGDIDSARDLLAQAWHELQDAEIGAHFGEVLWQLGKQEQALAVWQQALKDNRLLPVLIKTIETYAPQLLEQA